MRFVRSAAAQLRDELASSGRPNKSDVGQDVVQSGLSCARASVATTSVAAWSRRTLLEMRCACVGSSWSDRGGHEHYLSGLVRLSLTEAPNGRPCRNAPARPLTLRILATSSLVGLTCSALAMGPARHPDLSIAPFRSVAWSSGAWAWLSRAKLLHKRLRACVAMARCIWVAAARLSLRILRRRLLKLSQLLG